MSNTFNQQRIEHYWKDEAKIKIQLLTKLKINVLEYLILFVIYKSKIRMSQQDISDIIGISQTSLSPRIIKLINLGRIELRMKNKEYSLTPSTFSEFEFAKNEEFYYFNYENRKKMHLHHNIFALYEFICNIYKNRKLVNAGDEYMKSTIGVSDRAVRKSLKKLKQIKFIKIIRLNKQRNIIPLIFFD